MLEIKNVAFAYPRSAPLMEQLNLKVADGETVGLVGCNGAGKSTLLSLLCGLQFPSEGSIEIDGVAVKKDNLMKIRKSVGLVFQNPDDQLFMPNVLEDVMFGPRNYGYSEVEAREKAEEALTKMGILELKDSAPYNLSGGEKRSAAIATVLSMNPDLLLFDEPTAFLDPRATKNFEVTLKGLSLSYIVASHNLDFILNICQRVIILKKGKIIADGKAMDILGDEALLEKAGLELPISLQRCSRCKYDFFPIEKTP